MPEDMLCNSLIPGARAVNLGVLRVSFHCHFAGSFGVAMSLFSGDNEPLTKTAEP